VILDHLNDMLTLQKKNHDFSKHPSWQLCLFWLRIRTIWLEALIDEVTYVCVLTRMKRHYFWRKCVKLGLTYT
jgi:hypothetical protein